MIDDYVKTCIEKDNALNLKRQALQNELSKINEDRRTLCMLAIQHIWGVEVGTIVKDGWGALHKVTFIVIREWKDIEDYTTGRPWIKATRIRKDGTYGTAERHLYENWKLENEA